MTIHFKTPTCPECGGKLYADIVEWETETGIPTDGGVTVHCETEDAELGAALDDDSIDDDYLKTLMHRHWQSEWQPIIDQITRYCQETPWVAQEVLKSGYSDSVYKPVPPSAPARSNEDNA